MDVAAGCVDDLRRAAKEIAGDDGAADSIGEGDVLFVLAELASADEDRTGAGLNGGAIAVAAPLHESAVAETDGSVPGDFRNLIAGAPEGAVAEADHAMMRGTDFDHGGIGSVERSEFGIRDEQGILRALFDEDCAVAVVCSDSEKVAIAFSGIGGDEFVAQVVAVAEGIEDILPIGTTEDEGLAILHLPVVNRAVRIPPGIEVNVLDPADVVDGATKIPRRMG